MAARSRQQHGLTTVLRGGTPTPADAPALQALAAWRDELVTSLGGADRLSAQQATLIELACRQRWVLDQIDAWLFAQPSPVNKRKRTYVLAAPRLA
jgi:hypothetical protein